MLDLLRENCNNARAAIAHAKQDGQLNPLHSPSSSDRNHECSVPQAATELEDSIVRAKDYDSRLQPLFQTPPCDGAFSADDVKDLQTMLTTIRNRKAQFTNAIAAREAAVTAARAAEAAREAEAVRETEAAEAGRGAMKKKETPSEDDGVTSKNHSSLTNVATA